MYIFMYRIVYLYIHISAYLYYVRPYWQLFVLDSDNSMLTAFL